MTNPFAVFSDFPYTPVVGLALAASCSIISVFIVLRKMAMISEAIAHSGILGLAVALLIGRAVPVFLHPAWGSAMQQIVVGVFGMLTALLISYFTRGKHVSEDSAIGIALVATMALGVLLLDVNSKLPRIAGQPRAASIESILFGDILAVTRTDMWIALGVLGLVVVLVGAFYHEMVYATLDEEMARINGVNARMINVLQLFLTALVIDLGLRMVGGLMITALIVLPGATAAMLSRRFNRVLLASFLIGTVGIGTGFTLALNEPFSRFIPGPILVLTLMAVFLAVWLGRRMFKPRAALVPATTTT